MLDVFISRKNIGWDDFFLIETKHLKISKTPKIFRFKICPMGRK